MIEIIHVTLAIVAFFMFLAFILSIIMYYGVIVIDLWHNDYNTKKDFFKHLIPYYKWIKPMIDNFNEMGDDDNQVSPD